jgi:anti-sigma regulatory factor (Ser/Thr protein kinase)
MTSRIGSPELPALAGIETLPGILDLFAPCYWARKFSGATDQVRAVRQFVRQYLAGHPAVGDVVAVSSELAANSAVHSASSAEGGWFLVQVAAIDNWYAAVIVTDQGGPPIPEDLGPVKPSAESGRGLPAVRSLSCTFFTHDHDDGRRSFIAVVPPPAKQSSV